MSIQPRYADRLVAAYACAAQASRGRLYVEDGCSLRTPFQRDRDRIVHSSAFRRLTYKTQVFVYHEGDHYRTRLTHSLEVAQIARTLARILRLDEDLAETIALAHDLGHPPFGHAGEEALHEVAKPFGGFDHNAQSLRTVTKLESRYASYDGLNLTWETLEGLVKHNGPLLDAAGNPTPRYAAEGLPQAIVEYGATHDLDLASHASLEAQVAALADDIAYNNHDLDDGLRAGLIAIDKLRDVPLAGRFIQEVEAKHGALPVNRLIYEVNRRLISAMVHDLSDETLRRIAELDPKSADDIRNAGHPVAAFSEEMKRDMAELRRFLFAEFYFHPRVQEIMNGAQKIVTELFNHFLAHPEDLPEGWREKAIGDRKGRVISDFVAGMTDRLALDTHRGLFDDTPRLR
ncbi:MULTISPECIES: deoxyguanosinetriphosphate triphosphohydrolase [Rhodomicrobium]|uniref:deoxyguanosinetriphosphate triphosphohydrolase n=1 Tax=Rhodomicrobium TaxID=1068 RepID=UPI000B4BB24F|nr:MULTISPECIES: deoxyguanosinetriphosphate triphosphohydrolase [Rhodomicrobium]